MTDVSKQSISSPTQAITIAEVQQKLLARDTFFLIDVREQSEWNQGHLPGAIHLSKSTIEGEIERIIPDKTTTLILYCGGGTRARLAAETLQKMGYENVFSMQGGYRGWAEQGLEIIQT